MNIYPNQTDLAELARLASESKLRAFFAAINPNLIYIYDLLEKRTVYVNREIGIVLGYSPEAAQELGDLAFTKLMHPNDLAKVPQKLKKFYAFQEGEVLESEYRLRHKNGEWHWFLSRDSVFTRTADGKPKQIIGTAIDISDRKSVEEELINSQSRLSFLFKQTPLALIEINLDLEIVDWNPTAELIFGYQKDQILGINITRLVMTENHQELMKLSLLELIRTQSSSCSINENITKDGKIIICEWHNTSLIDQHGNAIGAAATVVDITARKYAESALQQAKETADKANLTKSLFLANMSHELRTPLNAILGFSQLLERDLALNPEQREYVTIINRSGEHLLTLINDILSMSQIEAGKLTLNENCFNLYNLLDHVEQMLQVKAKSKGLKLIHERSIDLPQFVQTDENKLRQVLLNLLGNSIKFTDIGQVKLQVSKADEIRSLTSARLLFKVADTGLGIASEELATLFDPFVQTETGRKSQEGSGLGLPISRKFVQMMGGDIWVSSIPNQGTIFTFDIQVTLSRSPKIETKKAKIRVIGLAPEQPPYRILIVDDAKINRLPIIKFLKRIGFQVCEAENGQEAVDLCLSWQPHLILMDMRMPIMDGYAATKSIKATNQSRFNPVIIALTASTFDEERAAILAAGCDDFLSKPFQEDVILTKIAEHLQISYIYESENQQPSLAKLTLSTEKPTKEMLQTKPNEWLKRLYYGAICADADLIFNLLAELPDDDAALNKELFDLVNNYQFDTIIELLQ